MWHFGFLVTLLSPSPTAEHFKINDTYSQVIRGVVSEEPKNRECTAAFTRRGDLIIKVNVCVYYYYHQHHHHYLAGCTMLPHLPLPI